MGRRRKTVEKKIPEFRKLDGLDDDVQVWGVNFDKIGGEKSNPLSKKNKNKIPKIQNWRIALKKAEYPE